MTDQAAYFAADAEDRRAALADATEHIAAAQSSYHWGDWNERCDDWLRAADRAYEWLRRRESLVPARIVAGPPVITEQADVPALPKAGSGMPTVITDTQIATYPAAQDVDSKGFPLSNAVTLTDDDTAGAIVTRTDNADGSSSFSAVAPGLVNLTWSDGTLSLADTLEVDPGAAAQIQVGAPVITDQAPAAPAEPAPPADGGDAGDGSAPAAS